MPSSLNGTGVTFNDATTLQSGNIPAANLGSGTANSSVFLRGDKVWATVPAAAPSTADVLNATAGASAGAVGSYAFLGDMTNNNTNIAAGSTIAGSNLRYSCAINTQTNDAIDTRIGGTPAGTWRLMGSGSRDLTSVIPKYVSLFLRIS